MTPSDAVKVTDYCAFVDVLGYKSLLLEASLGSDAQRLEHLLQLWEAMTLAIDETIGSHPTTESKMFSDALYVSSIDLTTTVLFAASIYVKSYYYYEHRDSDWMPWLRGGIGSGWLVSVLDATLSSRVSHPTHAFDNPAGPAIAHAYELASDPCFKGMRLLIPKSLKDQAWPDLRHAEFPGHATMQQNARLLASGPWPRAGITARFGEVYDVPWWLLIDDGLARDRILQKHKWQAKNGRAAEVHFEESLRLLRS